MKSKIKTRTSIGRLRPESVFASVLLCAAVLTGALWLLFTPKQTYSQEENRPLQSLPKLTLNTICDGSFMQKFGGYVGDHFPLRTQLVSLNTGLRLLTGQRDFASDYTDSPADGGVYIGKGGRLYDVLLPDRSGIFEKNSDALAEFAEASNVPFCLLPVPSSTQEQPQNLPTSAPNYDQRGELHQLQAAAAGKFTVVDIFNALSLNNGDFYFRTDHHWNTDGAYIGYCALAGAMGFTPVPQTDFEYRSCPEPFFGSLYSKAVFPFARPDTLILPYDKKNCNITCESGDETRSGIYWEEYLTQKDKYSAYLGGNFAVAVVRNPEAEGGKLLLLKDSFANSMVPYLAASFSEIDLIDLRYYSGDLYQYMKQNNIRQAAGVYSLEQLCGVSIANQLTPEE